jgi:CRISPR/Cas system-associated endonuclease Cas1
MILNIPFVELNKFRVSATTPICDAVLDYCQHYGIPVEYYGQITRPVCEFVARSIGVDPNIIVEWEDAYNYPDLSVLVKYAPDFMNNDGFNREKYINLMIERHEHLIIETVW